MFTVNVNVNITAPDLIETLQALKTVLVLANPRVDTKEIVAKVTPTELKPEKAKPEALTSEFSFKLDQKSEPAPEPEPTTGPEKATPATEPTQAPEPGTTPVVTLEHLKTKLAAMSMAGKQVQVKGLITKFGATKISDIPAEKYPELLKAAEALA